MSNNNSNQDEKRKEQVAKFLARRAEIDKFVKENALAQNKGVLGHARDTGLSLLSGAVSVPEAVVGIADIPTGGRVGKFLENQDGAIGFRPKEAKEAIADWKTDRYKEQMQEFQEADGFMAKTGVALSNPSIIRDTVAESLPAMGAGGVVGRGIGAVAPRLAGVAGGAIGEGAVGAGLAAEQIRQQTEDGLLTAKQSGLAGVTGITTGAFGYGGGRLAKRLGISDIDTLSAGGAAGSTANKGLVRRVGEGALTEGLFEELPQSVSEQMLQNAALDKDIFDEVDAAASLGLLSGAAMGGGAAVRKQGGTPPPTVTPPTEAQPTGTPAEAAAAAQQAAESSNNAQAAAQQAAAATAQAQARAEQAAQAAAADPSNAEAQTAAASAANILTQTQAMQEAAASTAEQAGVFERESLNAVDRVLAGTDPAAQDSSLRVLDAYAKVSEAVKAAEADPTPENLKAVEEARAAARTTTAETPPAAEADTRTPAEQIAEMAANEKELPKPVLVSAKNRADVAVKYADARLADAQAAIATAEAAGEEVTADMLKTVEDAQAVADDKRAKYNGIAGRVAAIEATEAGTPPTADEVIDKPETNKDKKKALHEYLAKQYRAQALVAETIAAKAQAEIDKAIADGQEVTPEMAKKANETRERAKKERAVQVEHAGRMAEHTAANAIPDATPAEKMGLNENNGGLEAAAATAANTGVIETAEREALIEEARIAEQQEQEIKPAAAAAPNAEARAATKATEPAPVADEAKAAGDRLRENAAIATGANGDPKFWAKQNEQKAHDFIAKKNIGDTHEVVEVGNRVEIRPKSLPPKDNAQTEDAPARNSWQSGVDKILADVDPNTDGYAALVKEIDGNPLSVSMRANINQRAKALADQPAAAPVKRNTAVKDKTKISGTSFTADNDTIPYQWDVIDAKDLVSSHTNTFGKNPDFPSDYQPRDRADAGYQAQVLNIQKEFNPKILGDSNLVSDGSPFVGRNDNIVESGNGRTIAIRRTYDEGKGEEYRQFVKDSATKFGLDADAVAGMEQPILVRRNMSDMDRATFASRANKDSIATMGATDRAKSDVKVMPSPELIELSPTTGSINLKASYRFVQDFIAAVGTNEAVAMTAKDGSLSVSGEARIKAAILHSAYGSDMITQAVAEATDVSSRHVLNSLTDKAPQIVKLNELTKNGKRDPNTLASDIKEAAETYINLKETGANVTDYLYANSMNFDEDTTVGKEVSPAVREIIIDFDTHSASGAKMREKLQARIDAADRAGNPNAVDIFGDTADSGTTEAAPAETKKAEQKTAAKPKQEAAPAEAAATPMDSWRGHLIKSRNALKQLHTAGHITTGEMNSVFKGKDTDRMAEIVDLGLRRQAEANTPAADTADTADSTGIMSGWRDTPLKTRIALGQLIGKGFISNEERLAISTQAYEGKIDAAEAHTRMQQLVEKGLQAQAEGKAPTNPVKPKHDETITIGKNKVVSAFVGENKNGYPLYENASGTRSFEQQGVIVTEGIAITPTGGERELRTQEYLTKEELAIQAKAQKAKESTPTDPLPTPSTKESLEAKFAGNTAVSSDKAMKALAILQKARDKAAAAKALADIDMLSDAMSDPSNAAFVDDETMIAGMTLTSAFVESGTTDFTDYAQQMVEIIGPEIAPMLMSYWSATYFNPALSAQIKSGMTKLPAAEQLYDKLIATQQKALADDLAARDKLKNSDYGVADIDKRSDGDAIIDFLTGKEDKGATNDGRPSTTIAEKRDTVELPTASEADATSTTGSNGEVSVADVGAVDARSAEQNDVSAEQGERTGTTGRTADDAVGSIEGSTQSSDGADKRTDATGSGKRERQEPLSNYRLTEEDLKREGSWYDTAERNVQIVELVKEIQESERTPTAAERELMAKYTGWGASQVANNVFPNPITGKFKEDRYGALNERLQEVLTTEEYETARRTTQYAHYTPPQVVQGIYKALSHFGFAGGQVLEPASGIGIFNGLMPDAMAANSKYTGVELDSITGAIAQLLYPQSNMAIGDYIKTVLPDNTYDAAIGNPPFANISYNYGKGKDKQKFQLHDYFFAKTIDKVKAGGVVAFVTSKGTMDKQSDAARSFLMERADLIGAIRLPQTAFLENAGTEVITDIIFLRKRHDGEQPSEVQWGKTKQVKVDGDTYSVNEYFANNPQMIMGTPASKTAQYGKAYTVTPSTKGTLGEQIEAAVATMPRNVFNPTRGSKAEQAKVTEMDFGPDTAQHKEGGVYVKDGVVMRMMGGAGKPLTHRLNGKLELTELTPDNLKWLADYVGLREASKAAQLDQLNDSPNWKKSLATLNKVYDAFVKKHGHIQQHSVVNVKQKDGSTTTYNKYKNQALLMLDAEQSMVRALDKTVGVSKDGKQGIVEKGEFLTGRTLSKPKAFVVNNTQDALEANLNETGILDIARIAELINKPPNEVIAELGDQIYYNPENDWELAEEYLSGNVVEKLEQAVAEAKNDPSMKRNVEALKKAQPEPIAPSDISTNLGSGWIPTEVIEQFSKEVTGQTITVERDTFTGGWHVKKGYGRLKPEFKASGRDHYKMMESILSGVPISIRVSIGDGKTMVSTPLTAEANNVAKLLQNAFDEWIFSDAARRDKLAADYNKRYNNIVPAKYGSGEFLKLDGMSNNIKLRPHQLRGIQRVIRQGDVYLNHAVGAGKTFTMIAAAMEEKRLGLINKPMFIVPNHMLDQFSQEFLMLYPAANIMVADDKQFVGHRRREFVAQATLNAPDAVIMTHSSFKMLGVSSELQIKFLRETVAEWREALENSDQNNNQTVKSIESAIEKANSKIGELLKIEGQDNNVTFENMGVDRLYVDEMHEYRKLTFATKKGNIKGIDPNGSQEALDLSMKVGILRAKHGNRVLVGASGTPVTNTMGELFTVQRFFQPDQLKKDGLHHFDGWSSQFGSTVAGLEQNAAGTYVTVPRFAKFLNLPELMSRVRSFMDTLTNNDLGALVTRPDVIGGGRSIEITPIPDGFTDYQASLGARIDAIKKRGGKPEKGDDVVLSVITDGRLSGIDMRFTDPTLPSDPNSKINVVISDLVEAYKETADNVYTTDGVADEKRGSALMLFSDLGLGSAVTKSRGFDMQKWIKDELIRQGIDPNHIAFMSDYTSHAKKGKLFEEMRSGEKRILVGGKNMETGVNVQKRLSHLFHLDAPWFPASVEQREGRIIRQGNQNKEVTIKAYATKSSYDSTMWGMVARKARFIEQAFQGDASLRSMEDMSESSAFEQAAALASGDPRHLQLAGLRQEVEAFMFLKKAFDSRQNKERAEVEQERRYVASAERYLNDVKPLVDAHKVITVEEIAASLDGKVMPNAEPADRKLIGEAIVKAYAKLNNTEFVGDKEIAKINGYPLIYTGYMTKLGNYISDTNLEIPVMGRADSALIDNANLDKVRPDGLVERIKNRINAIPKDADKYAKSMEDAKTNIRALEGSLARTFVERELLEEKQRELAELEASIEQDYKDAEAAKNGTSEAAPQEATDVDNASNKIRKGDVTNARFKEVFGLKELEAGITIDQEYKNSVYDAYLQLSEILGIPTEAIGLAGELTMSLGANNKDSALFRPTTATLSLNGDSGDLAHEWFHALDNHFTSFRTSIARNTTPENANITMRPEPQMVYQSPTGKKYHGSKGTLANVLASAKSKSDNPNDPMFDAKNWSVDEKHPMGVRPQVEKAFANVVNILDESDIKTRSFELDKSERRRVKYWSSTVELAARTFEGFIKQKMQTQGKDNDVLVRDLRTEFDGTKRPESQYPFANASEIAAIEKAFDNLFSTIESKVTEDGKTTLYSQSATGTTNTTAKQVIEKLSNKFGKATIQKLLDNGVLEIKTLSDYVVDGKLTIPNDVDGIYDNGKAILIADNLTDDMIIPTFLHELGGHGGLQTLMSDKAYAGLMRDFDALVAAGDPIAVQAKAMADKVATNKQEALDEYLPYLVTVAARQAGKQGKVTAMINRIAMAIRSFLASKFGVSIKTDANDILALAERMITERSNAITAPNNANNAQQFSNPNIPAKQLDDVRAKYESTDAWLKAPNGKDTNLNEQQWLQVRTPAFKQWFGDWEGDAKNASKVVDDNGEPKVMYHGTGAEFTEFDGKSMTWLSDDASFAGEYAEMRAYINKSSPTTMPLFVNIKNIFDADSLGRSPTVSTFINNLFTQSNKPVDNDKRSDIVSQLRDMAREEGSGPYYAKHSFWHSASSVFGMDGERLINDLIKDLGFDGITSTEDEKSTVGAINPNQIKSATDNVGTFDENNPDIRMSRRRYVDENQLGFDFDAIEEAAPEVMAISNTAPANNPELMDQIMDDEARLAWREANKVSDKDGQKRKDLIAMSAKKYKEGEIEQKNYLKAVKDLMPITPMGKIPKLPALLDIGFALDKNKIDKEDVGIVGVDKVIDNNTRVGLRLDIPAYNNYDTWVVSIHDGTKPSGKSLGYAQTGYIANVEFATRPLAALNIAIDSPKATIARMHGDWINHSPEQLAQAAEQALASDEWIEVGMNPFRHSWFYDKADGLPVVSADEVIQIGAMVLARHAQKTTVDDAQFDTGAKGNNVKFSRAAGAPDPFSPRAIATEAGLRVYDWASSAPSGKLSWWHKTIGTMYNLAQRNPMFKPVFEHTEKFINDVAFYASKASEFAPRLLPRLDSIRDLTKSAIGAKDNEVVGKPIFEGTLLWTRDKNGEAVLIDDWRTKVMATSIQDRLLMLQAAGKITPKQEADLAALRGVPAERYINAIIDAEFTAGIVWTDDELTDKFNLSAEQIELYREFRAATDHSLDNMTRSDMLRRLGQDANDIETEVMEASSLRRALFIIENHIEGLITASPNKEQAFRKTFKDMKVSASRTNGLIAKGYAPLSRFGKYTVDVLNAQGEREYFGLFESAYEARKMREQMEALYDDGVVTQGALSEEEFKLFAGVTPETAELFGEMLGLDATGDTAGDVAFQEYLRHTKNNRSAMKRLIHRKGIKGYSEDVGRVLASFIYSNARHTSAAINMGNLDRSIQQIPQKEGELKDAAVKLAQYIKNPQEEGNAIRGLMFAQYLGGSIASAVVNLTQPIAVSFPYLSQFGGTAKAAAALGKSSTDWAARIANKNAMPFEPDLQAAITKAEADGTLSPQEVHNLLKQARGQNPLRAGDGTKIGNTKAIAQNSLSRLGVSWGAFFSLAEQANRRITFVAAYRIAKEQGMADPADFAKKSINETQFVYNKASRMQWGRGAVGGTLMTFKTYSVSYIELMHRLWTQGDKGSAERKQGQKAAMVMMATLFLLGGGGGLPFMEDIEDVVDGMSQMLGYNLSTRKARQDLLDDVFGEAFGEFLESGISGIHGMPADVSGRLGMDNLIPATGIFKKRTNNTRDVMELGGPAGDFIARSLTGTREIVTGAAAGDARQVGRGALELTPVAVRNAFKGGDMLKSGTYKDGKGYKVADTSTLDAILKGIGFQPEHISKMQQKVYLGQSETSYYSLRAAEIRALWAKGIVSGDKDMIADARKALVSWNKKNPKQKITIRPADIQRRVREMKMNKTDRIAKRTPVNLRAQRQKDLQEFN